MLVGTQQLVGSFKLWVELNILQDLHSWQRETQGGSTSTHRLSAAVQQLLGAACAMALWQVLHLCTGRIWHCSQQPVKTCARVTVKLTAIIAGASCHSAQQSRQNHQKQYSAPVQPSHLSAHPVHGWQPPQCAADCVQCCLPCCGQEISIVACCRQLSLLLQRHNTPQHARQA